MMTKRLSLSITRHGVWALFALLLVVSCSKDNETFPSLRADFYDVVVDKDSAVTTVILDNGKSYIIEEQEHLKAYVCDTIIRCFGTIEISEDSTSVYVHTINQAICYAPSTKENYKNIKFYKYPVSVVAIYKARSYVNVIVSSKISGKYEHSYDFIKDSLTTRNGSKIMHITLFHWQPDEETGMYGQKCYLSLPLGESFYKEDEKFDSVEITINTQNGEKKYMY